MHHQVGVLAVHAARPQVGGDQHAAPQARQLRERLQSALLAQGGREVGARPAACRELRAQRLRSGEEADGMSAVMLVKTGTGTDNDVMSRVPYHSQ